MLAYVSDVYWGIFPNSLFGQSWLQTEIDGTDHKQQLWASNRLIKAH